MLSRMKMAIIFCLYIFIIAAGAIGKYHEIQQT